MVLARQSPTPPDADGAVDMTTLGGETTTHGPGGGATRLALTILWHPRVDRVGERALLPERGTALSRVEPVFARPGGAPVTMGDPERVPQTPPGGPLDEEHVSRAPLHLVPGRDGSVRLSIGESKTAVAVRERAVSDRADFSAEQLREGVVLRLGSRVVLLLHRVASLPGLLDGEEVPGEVRELAGESDALQRVLWQIQNVAPSSTPVLIRGETGSGKELVARALHRASPRRDRPFEAVNLGAIPASVATAELFGTEAGGFSGAVRRPGLCERAHGGTLFLDEIGEAPVDLQVALLRFLETGELQTVGARQARKVDVRVVAATDADLEAKMAGSTFRPALLNRLSGYEIRVPSLRERRDDIGRLLVGFLREELLALGAADRLLPAEPGKKPWLPAPLVSRLAAYSFPGNVRQLRNVVKQLVIDNHGRARVQITESVDRLLAEPARAAERDIADEPSSDREVAAPPRARSASASEPPVSTEPPVAASSAGGRTRKVSDEEVQEALRATGWDRAAAARRLGVSRAYLYLPRFNRKITAEDVARAHREHGGDPARMAEQLQLSERALAEWLRKLGLEPPR